MSTKSLKNNSSSPSDQGPEKGPEQGLLISLVLVMTGFVSVGLLGFLIMSHWEEQTDRMPASISSSSKTFISLEEKISQQNFEPAKLRAPLQVRIASSEIPDSPDFDVKLQATVYVNREISEPIYYQWTLPESVSVVEGNLNDSFSSSNLGEQKQVYIIVNGFTKESAQLITFNSYFGPAERRMGASAVLSSRPEDHLEYLAPKMLKAVRKMEENRNAKRE